MTIIHYAGEIRTKRMRILPGFAACCSGDKAWKIHHDGNTTRDRSQVTCKACLRVMARAVNL